MAESTDPHYRAQVEEQELERWVPKFLDIMLEARLSFVLKAERQSDPEKARRRLVGRTKPKTLSTGACVSRLHSGL